MDKLGSVVAEHIEQRLLQPKRLRANSCRACSTAATSARSAGLRISPNCASVRPKQKPNSSDSTTRLRMESPTCPTDAQGAGDRAEVYPRPGPRRRRAGAGALDRLEPTITPQALKISPARLAGACEPNRAATAATTSAH